MQSKAAATEHWSSLIGQSNYLYLNLTLKTDTDFVYRGQISDTHIQFVITQVTCKQSQLKT